MSKIGDFIIGVVEDHQDGMSIKAIAKKYDYRRDDGKYDYVGIARIINEYGHI